MDATNQEDEDAPLPAHWHHPDHQQQQHSADGSLLSVHPTSPFAVGPGVDARSPFPPNPSASLSLFAVAVSLGVDAQPPFVLNPSASSPSPFFAVGPDIDAQPQSVWNPSASSPSPFFAVGPSVDAQPQAAPNPSSYPPSGFSITAASNPSSYLPAAPNPSSYLPAASNPSSYLPAAFSITAASNPSSYHAATSNPFPHPPPGPSSHPSISHSHSTPTPAFHDPYQERAFLATMDVQIAIIAAYIKKSNSHIKKALLCDLEKVLERRVTELAVYNQAPQSEDRLRALELCNRLVERLQEEVALMREAYHPTLTAPIMEHYRGLYVTVRKRRVVLDGGSSDQELEEEIRWKKKGLVIA